MAWIAKRSRYKPECYDVPNGHGGTMRVQLGRKPDEKTIKALQDLAVIVRRSAKERGVDDVSPEFQDFLNVRTASTLVPTESPEPAEVPQVSETTFLDDGNAEPPA